MTTSHSLKVLISDPGEKETEATLPFLAQSNTSSHGVLISYNSNFSNLPWTFTQSKYNTPMQTVNTYESLYWAFDTSSRASAQTQPRDKRLQKVGRVEAVCCTPSQGNNIGISRSGKSSLQLH